MIPSLTLICILSASPPTTRHAEPLASPIAHAQACGLGASMVMKGSTLLTCPAAPVLPVQDGKACHGVHEFSFRDGRWQYIAALPELESPSIQIGHSLDFDGKHALTGAVWDLEQLHAFRGHAVMFARTEGAWKLEQSIPAEPDARMFGWAVAIDGEWAFVSAPSGQNAAVYVYRSGESGWRLKQKIVAPAKSRDFGLALDAVGDTLAVADRASNSVHVYTLEGETWRPTQTLTDPDAKENDWLGQSIAIAVRRIVVGTVQYEDRSDRGYAVVFAYSAEHKQWELQQRLLAPNGAPRDLFGASVAISGDTIAIGASGVDGPDGPTGERSGAAYTFVHRNNRWECHEKILAPEGDKVTSFGHRVAIGDGFIAISSPDTPRSDKAGPSVKPGKIFIHKLGTP